MFSAQVFIDSKAYLSQRRRVVAIEIRGFAFLQLDGDGHHQQEFVVDFESAQCLSNRF